MTLRGLLAILGAFVLAVSVITVPFMPPGWLSWTDAAYLVVSVGLLMATAALSVAAAQIQGVAAGLAAGLVVAAAICVGITLAVSLVDAYGREALIVGQLVALAGALVLWSSTGRARIAVQLPSAGQLRRVTVSHPCLAALLLALILATFLEAVLALGVVPNNYDSMFYHLSRIGYWMQNNSVFQFYGGSVFQLQHPPNAEILQGWSMELTRGDRFAQFVQWTALIGLVCVVYEGARSLRFSRPASLFAAALFGTLPLPVLEASSTQNDLVAAFFVCAAALFLVRGIAGARSGDFVIGALALGLAVGTKGTVLLVVPWLVVLALVAWWRWRPPRGFVAVGCVLAFVAMAGLGAPNYVQTALNTGSPIGEAAEVKRRTEPLPSSAVKTMSGFVDLPGRSALPPAAEALVRGEEKIWGAGTAGVSTKIDVHEDFTGFGPIGLLLVLPLLAYTAIGRRGVPGDQRLIAVVALGYIALFLLTTAAQPFDMRLMIVPVALGAPLLASAEGIPWIRRLTVLVAAIILVPVLFANQQKPLLPEDFSLGQDIAAQRGASNENFDVMLSNTDEAIDEDRRVGFVGTALDWDYPLFGQHFERFVVRLPEATTWSEAAIAMRLYDLDSVIWAVEPPSNAPAELVNLPDPPYKATARWVTDAG